MDNDVKAPGPIQYLGELKTVSWWQQNKSWVYPTVMLVVGLLTGNTDRISEVAPQLVPVSITRFTELENTVLKLDADIANLGADLETNKCKCVEQTSRTYDRPTE